VTTPAPDIRYRRPRPVTPVSAPSTQGVLLDEIDFLLATARQAPSPTDRRPWRFRARLGHLELLTARHPGGPGALVGPDSDRQDVIACGAALFNLRLAAAHVGVEPVVTLVPEPEDPGLLARLGSGGLREPHQHEEDLLAAVPRRHTRRTSFTRADLPSELLHDLAAAAAAEGVTMVSVTGGRALEVLDEQLTEAGRHVEHDPASGAGLRVPWPGAQVSTGRLEILTTAGDTAADRLRAGQALQRLLLTATNFWVAARFFTLALEDPLGRERIRSEVCGGRFPQVVLELGDALGGG